MNHVPEGVMLGSIKGGRSGGAKLSELMTRIDRNEGGITSRLVKQKAAPTREDIRVEDERRRKG